MNDLLQVLAGLLDAKEDEHLEFKEAKQNFHLDKLVKYSAALANEGGGSIVLGVTDRRPRTVVGTQAFQSVERTKAGLIERLRLRITIDEIQHPDGRVLIVTAPGRPIGMPIPVDGAYWMRGGEDLVPMTPDMLRRIFDESGPDFSAELCATATMADLDPRAVEEFRVRWHRKSGNDALLQESPEQLLGDAELVTDSGVTYAALILLGTRAALGAHLAQAEVIFEYRSSDAVGPASQREEFREGFLLYYERLWELVNLRNDRQHYQDGLFMVDVPTFSEGSVREALLNAIAHRDYRLSSSVFVRQFRRRIEIVSPGGFPPGVSPENILERQNPRNRRIAENLGRCGLVERSGQGADRMFEESIRQSKPLPDFGGTDPYQVSLTLHGEVQDPNFLRFLEKVGQENLALFNTRDFLLLNAVHREEAVPAELQPRLRPLVELGVVEVIGRGKGTRYLLSRHFYTMIGKTGIYTRRKGLDHRTNKELILQHLRENPAGSPLAVIQQVLPQLSPRRVQTLLRELREDGRVQLDGSRRWSRWKLAKDGNRTTGS
ncbi:MAG: ATP-binding protein [Candidatus Binatia bacterium]